MTENGIPPTAILWDRLAQRIAAEDGMEPFSAPPDPTDLPEWEIAALGISVKLLATDTSRKRVSMLVRLDAGVAYPPHCHAGVEELYLLDGELTINETKFYPGDYFRAEAESVDHLVLSETGCMCVLITSTNDRIL